MKKYVYIIAVFVVIGVIVYYLFFKKTASTTEDSAIVDDGTGNPVVIPENPLTTHSGTSSPSLKIDGDFGSKTEAALNNKFNKNSISYAEFISTYNILKSIIPVNPNYDTQFDKILNNSWSKGFYNTTENSFVVDPMTIINKNNFPLMKGSKGNEVVMLQFFLKFSK
jgi:hypothetical protein